MSSSVSYAKATLPYPLFAADFDPYNRGYLVVGGGGGESKTGVPNKISVLDISNRATIETAAEIDLSRDEDSVQCLGNLATKDGLITFAGINSSSADQSAGRNEHLRSFGVTYPPRKKQKTEKEDGQADGKVELLSKRQYFKSAEKSETYQRVLRLSPAQRREAGNKRIGAIATGMAKQSEVVVFSATSATPEESDIITRIGLPQDEEAGDIDIAEPDSSEFSVVYCTDYDLYEQSYKYNFGTKKVEKTPNGPRCIHKMDIPDPTASSKARAKFRSIRFLNPQNVVALCNKPTKSGAELRILHLYPTGPATLLLEKSLPSRIKSAVSMDVCALDADKNGNQQVVVAVAGQDISIEVFVTNYQRSSDTFSPFKHYITLRQVHQHNITKICLSPFHRPESPIGTQYIRLGSVSYGNTVVVDTFPLQSYETSDKNSRYLLSHPKDERFWNIAYVVVVSMIVLVTAFLLQSFLTGFSNAKSGPFSLLPQDVRDFLDQPAAAARGFGHRVEHTVASAVESTLPSAGRLREMLALHRPESGTQGKALIVRDSGDSSLSVDVHPDKQEYLKQEQAKHWEEMTSAEQANWKKKLIHAGEWAESEGEKVLLGVLFSSYAGAVGDIAREALAG
jgi:hypothetical protein